MEFSHSIIVTVFLSLGFLSVGSFLNVVIYRLPLMLNTQWLQDCSSLLKIAPVNAPKKPNNLFWPCSYCPSCNTPIKIRHNIPLLSYFLLRGRCAHCKAAIDWQYPLVELATCLLSLYTVHHFGFTWTAAFSLLFIWLLIPLTVIDFKHQLLPDSLTLSLLWLGLMANTLFLFTTPTVAIFSAAGAYLSLWLFIQLFYWLTGKIGMGHGDFKLFAALGAWFGWTQLPLILLLASFIGSIYGLIFLFLTQQKKETPIPFGPFLSLAGIIALFFGKAMMIEYLKIL